MPRDGSSGAYSLPAGNPVVSGTTISSTTHNATMTDVASALTASIAKDGQTVPTQNLPMGGFRHTGVGNPSARNQYATVDQVQDAEYIAVSSVSGTNTITGSLTPAITAYASPMMVIITPANTNTGATTLNLNGVGSLDVLNIDGSACVGGELVAGIPAILVLDSGADDWIIVNPNVLKSRGLEVGYRGLPFTGPFTTSAGGTSALQALSNGKLLVFSGAAGQTLTLASGLSPSDIKFDLINFGSGSLAITVSSGNFQWANGSGTVGTGARTFAVSGICTIFTNDGGANWNIFGAGLS